MPHSGMHQFARSEASRNPLLRGALFARLPRHSENLTNRSISLAERRSVAHPHSGFFRDSEHLRKTQR